MVVPSERSAHVDPGRASFTGWQQRGCGGGSDSWPRDHHDHERSLQREMESGSLVRLLTEWDVGELELNAVFAAGRAAKRSARAYVDYLTSALACA